MPARRMCDRGAIYTRAGERGRRESGLRLFRQAKIRRSGNVPLLPAGDGANATALDLVSWARQRGTGAPDARTCPVPRMAGNSDESGLGATGPGCHPGAVRGPTRTWA